MPAVPIYVWNGTAWQETGPTIPASPIKYQASAPSSPSTGDIWVDSDADVTTGSQQFQRFRFVASGGETTISGVDANGATLAYTAGAELVVLNGSTLVRGQDYTATNGTSITGLSPALVASDVLEVFSFMAFNVANTYTQSQADGLFALKPLGIVGYTSATNTTTFTVNTPTTILTLTPTITAGRLYMATGNAAFQSPNAVGSRALWFEESSQSLKRTIGYGTITQNSNLPWNMNGSIYFTAAEVGVTSGTATKTCLLRFNTNASGVYLNNNPDGIVGTGSSPQQFIIQDIGAA